MFFVNRADIESLKTDVFDIFIAGYPKKNNIIVFNFLLFLAVSWPSYLFAFSATYTAGTGGAADAESTVGSDKFIRITAGTGTVTFS